MNAIALKCASLEILDDRPDYVILVYDERGTSDGSYPYTRYHGDSQR
jgi:hypothetical protein